MVFLISDDATPNVNGAILTNLITKDKIVSDLKELNQKIQIGQCKNILSLDEEIFADGVSHALPDEAEIFYVGIYANKTSERATVTIPVTTVFERIGTFINMD
jgi:NADH dehydrogenase/NADH:ubiquinone oxidoreductase subunit G